MNFVFVHLGKASSPTLLHHAWLLEALEVEASSCLITDRPDDWKAFPGKVLTFSTEVVPTKMRQIQHRFQAFERIAKGYWFHTLNRLFALSQVYEIIEPNTPFVHIESDVFPMFTKDAIKWLESKATRVTYPRYSTELGIASILFSPNKQSLTDFLSQIEEISVRQKAPPRDMEVLGELLNSGKADELRSLPSTSYEIATGLSSGAYLFDGAALGQYLFGQDPIHSQGLRVSGYVNPHAAFDSSKFNWRLFKNTPGDETVLQCSIDPKLVFNIQALHIHSKESLPRLDVENPRWQRALLEANNKIPRTAELAPTMSAHFDKVRVGDRLRLIRYYGVRRKIRTKFKRIVDTKRRKS